jgi:HK97 family phage portal protein
MRYYVTDGVKTDLTLDSARGWSFISGNDTTDLSTVQAWASAAYVHRAVDLRAQAVSSMPWGLYRAGSDTDLKDDERYKSLVRGMRVLLWRVEAALCIYGAAYLLPVSNRAGLNLRLDWLLPSSIVPRYDSHGLSHFDRVVPWMRQRDNERPAYQRIETDDLVYIWLPSLQYELAPGLPPVAVACKAAGVMTSLDSFAQGFFDRGAIKMTLLAIDGNPSNDAMQKLEGWWNSIASGVKNAWKSIVIRANMQPVVIGEGIKELADEVLTTHKREDISAALGVPHSLMSADAANYATAEQDTLNFYQTTAVPQALLIEEVINAQLFERLGLQLRFDPSMLECFQKSEVQKAQSIVPLVSGGIVSIDEARLMLGYEPLPQEEPPEDGKPQQTSTFDQQVQAMYLRMKTRSHGR